MKTFDKITLNIPKSLKNKILEETYRRKLAGSSRATQTEVVLEILENHFQPENENRKEEEQL